MYHAKYYLIITYNACNFQYFQNIIIKDDHKSGFTSVSKVSVISQSQINNILDINGAIEAIKEATQFDFTLHHYDEKWDVQLFM